MSNRALSWAFETELPSTPKFVLVVLADMADELNSCWPSQEYIARAAGMGLSTVARALKTLEKGGYVIRTQRRRPDGSRTSDRYVLIGPGRLPHSR